MTRIAIIDGHPDPNPGRFVHALAQAYADGASGRHEIRTLTLAELQFPVLRSKHEWETGAVVPAIADAQSTIRWAEHLVFLYPLWLGDLPALFKAFLEQVARPSFVIEPTEKGMPRKLLKGRSARGIVTMGMPALFYSIVYRAHSLKSLERNILAFSGIRPVRSSIIGGVEGGDRHRRRWIERVRDLGAKAR